MQQSVERRQQRDPRLGGGIELDLIIPALNEEQRIGATLVSISEKAADSKLAVRILVVDNGCVDATSEVVTDAQCAEIPVEIISCRTKGKGAAVRAGVRHSTAPYVGYCDADRSTPASAVESGIDLLRSGWEVVIGSRRCTGAGYSTPQGNLRRLGSFAFRKMASDLSGPITDTQCGFKLFHSKVGKDLFSSGTMNGFAFDVEVLAQARQRNHRMIELPIQWSDDPQTSFRPLADGLKSFGELWKIRRSLDRPDPPVSWR